MRLTCLGALPLVLVAGCADRFGVTLLVQGEGGEALSDAWAELDGQRVDADADGRIRLRRLEAPVAALVGAPDHLAEPALVGRWDEGDPVPVRLLSDEGGARVVMNFAGDVMLGRRYETPEAGDPLLYDGDGGESARALVADAAPVFAAADLVSLNLESVVGELADADAYPAKRWLLLTHPTQLAAIESLGTDVVSLANNHQRDWLDDGVRSTVDELDAIGLDHVGAGSDAEQAAAPVILDVGGLSVGMLAWTSVDGDYVNDQYPSDDEQEPDAVADEDAYKWEWRSWGEPSLGVEVADRRIGGAWEALAAVEPGLDDAQRAALWASAEAVYPELQDWVARRGHGGAALWDATTSPAAVAALRAQVDLVIVQLHMGFQFADQAGDGVREAAHAAVDAGADLVVCHHPHVLQGMEWYDGHLVAWSLGNFIFDQDFLSTFQSGFLRVVWNADGSLAEARFVPGFLDAYTPEPVADGLSRRVARTLWDRSIPGRRAARGEDLVVRTIPVEDGTAGEAPTLTWEHGTVRLSSEALPTRRIDLSLPAEGATALPADGLARLSLSDPAPSGVQVGRDLFGLGSFEDDDVDGVTGEAIGWTWSSADVAVTRRRAGDGEASLTLLRQPGDQESVSARATARVPLVEHRLWEDADGATPLDGVATYSVHLRARISGQRDLGEIRLALYAFDDLDPTEDPSSTALGDLSLPLGELGAGWQDLWLDLPEGALDPVDGVTPNAALVYVTLEPPSHRTTLLEVDDVELIEWRPADEQPEGWGALDWARTTDGQARTVSADLLSW